MKTRQRKAYRALVLGAVIPALALAAGSIDSRTVSVQDQLTNPKYSAAEFDRIAREVFGPIYPYLAKQVKADYAITEGRAVDAGSGPGYWAIELAKITNLKISALDLDPEAIRIARRNIAAAGLAGRVEAVEGDVVKMPFADGSVDLVVSRGSYPFWKDKVRAFGEIRRILKPGGVALIGGGMGNLLPTKERARIREIMDREKIGPPKELEVSMEDMGRILRAAGINLFALSRDAGCLCGLWVEYRKPAKNP